VTEVRDLMAQVGIRAEQIFLMPEATSPEMLSERRRWLIGQCLEFGFRFSDRLHVAVWGSKRGV
jgi:organic radical activating enzyme